MCEDRYECSLEGIACQNGKKCENHGDQQEHSVAMSTRPFRGNPSHKQVINKLESNQRSEQCVHKRTSNLWSTLVAFERLDRKLRLIECQIIKDLQLKFS